MDWRQWRTATARPLLSGFIRDRRNGLLALGLATAQILVTAIRLPSWSCPWRDLTHTPCPGCGLSRACASILQGDFAQSIRLHPFAPVVLGAMTLILVGLLLPTPARDRFAQALDALERRTRLGIVLGGLLIVYAVVRLALGIDPDQFWRPPA